MSLAPKPIKKLNQDVINRIAAGEVIQRPANALKELIENCLDAKATNIQITVKDGGLKFLQIQDNGTGIRKEDFEIVCERFTTSKLEEFEDLHKISTYGFRGEALASISHVAHLMITSKTMREMCGYQAEYSDGKLKAPPKAVAGNQGTVITVEDLFYNMNVRKKALRSPAEEYQKISDVVSKYAVHNATVGFSLKKSGSNNDIRTPPNSTHTENIRVIYGSSIARELLEFSIENEQLKFTAKGHMTNVNFSSRKMQFLLFINHRLVDCQSLKKSIDTVYQTYLPKNAHPFVYLSLELDPNNIDVNVHPTKHEVHFLNESQIVDTLTTALEQKLLGSNNSRAFYTQMKLPTLHFETNREELKDKPQGNTSSNKPEAPKFTIRTDTNIQKLEKFFGPSVKKNNVEGNKSTKNDTKHKKTDLDDAKHEKNDLNFSITEEELNNKHEEFLKEQENFESEMLNETDDVVMIEDSPKTTRTEKIDESRKIAESHGDVQVKNMSPEKPCPKNTKESGILAQNSFEKCISTSQEEKRLEAPLSKQFMKKVTRVETKLTSVLQLRKAVEENCHRTLRETFAQHVFVGSISPGQALIQYGTQLLLCNTKTILEELFYQMVLFNFQNFDCYRFDTPMPIKDLALMGLNLPETGWTEEDGPKEELAQRICEILTEKGSMLNEYFSVDVDEKGGLKSLPILLDNYIPDPLQVPMYLIRLATEVKWETEKECFDTFSRETGKFYANVSLDNDDNGKDWKWISEYVLYPAIKEFFMPPKNFTKNAAVLEVANLPNLYKVFERC